MTRRPLEERAYSLLERGITDVPFSVIHFLYHSKMVQLQVFIYLENQKVPFYARRVVDIIVLCPFC